MKKKMRAITFLGSRQTAVKEVDLPEPAAGQVRVQLKGCGVCASNVPVWEGRSWFAYPYAAGAPGHEGWGVVDTCGTGVENLEPGQPVAALSYNSYAEYDVPPVNQIAALPEKLSSQPFPAEPLGCAVNVFRRCGAQPGETAAVVGAGFLGTLHKQHTMAALERGMAVFCQKPLALCAADVRQMTEMAKRKNRLLGIDLSMHGTGGRRRCGPSSLPPAEATTLTSNR